jgi:hypothetical protein
MAMQNITLTILEIKTREEKNSYERYREVAGCLYMDPFVFVIEFVCDMNGTKVYWAHRVNFVHCFSKHGSHYSFDKEETDFFKYEKGEKEMRTGGLRMDEEYYVYPHDKKIVKVNVGDTLNLRCQVEQKKSRLGTEYIQLKRVKLAKEAA